MRVEDLAAELGDQHGLEYGEMDGYVAEQLERLTYRAALPDLIEDLAEVELTSYAEQQVREAIANQFEGE